MPEVALHGFVKHLVIADGRLQERVPIHQPFAAIDFAVLEQAEEPLADGPGTLVVEREAGSLPIAATAHLSKLAEDAGLVLVLPFPDALHQPFAAQVVAGFLFFFEQPPLDDGLRGDAGVVGAGHPQRVVALHPLHANEDVLQRVVERVAEVEGAGDVRRRNDDAVDGPLVVRVRWRGSSRALPRRGTTWPARRRDRIGREVR